ncbi:mitochondrial import receptor subunit TOM9-1-like [Raphanus sativus]|uniref:Mitochondrial import receptor subunit TOM9-1-like n=1 Tax=Raphanus sativus TaxID=3726 RepID=A0A6J0KQZ2_RAPSA|nr:mitochondrial import receptor subunit TOM9-1-like [Raphanus sativus]
MATKRTGAGKSGGRDSSILAKIANHEIANKGRRAACDAVYVSKKLLRSTGKAAWIVGTSFLILVVPLLIQAERDQMLGEIELQQASILGPPPPGALQ